MMMLAVLYVSIIANNAKLNTEQMESLTKSCIKAEQYMEMEEREIENLDAKAEIIFVNEDEMRITETRTWYNDGEVYMYCAHSYSVSFTGEGTEKRTRD